MLTRGGYRDAITLSTGTVVDANFGVVGISYKDGVYEIYEGYDACLYADDMNAEDKRALADHMIAVWKAFKDHLEAKLYCDGGRDA